MIVVDDTDSIRGKHPYVVAAIGIFDGVHLGHQEILGRVVRRARAKGGTACAYTFANHPFEVLSPDRCPRLITPLEVKLSLIRSLGINLCIAVKFTPSLANTPPREFVERVLVRDLGVRELCIGFDFAFGKDRKGTPELLQELGREHGFDVEVVFPVRLGEQVVSSTLIRDLLQRGLVQEASRFLGHPYIVHGRVERGAGRGQALGYPTANLPLPDDFLIPDGVYAGMALLLGRLYDALVNVGSAPTFGEVPRRVEAYLPGLHEEVYGRELTLFFIERIRDERVFQGPEELREQIRHDEQKARDILSTMSPFLEKWALQSLGFCGNY